MSSVLSAQEQTKHRVSSVREDCQVVGWVYKGKFQGIWVRQHLLNILDIYTRGIILELNEIILSLAFHYL